MNFGELSYDSDDLVEIQMTIAYDFADIEGASSSGTAANQPAASSEQATAMQQSQDAAQTERTESMFSGIDEEEDYEGMHREKDEEGQEVGPLLPGPGPE